MKYVGPCLISILASLTLVTPASAGDDPYRRVWDDFTVPWKDNTAWSLLQPADTYTADDGCADPSMGRLVIHSCGVNHRTGEPAFRNTLSQSTGWLAAFDHAKWIAVMNNLSSNGLPGFDAVEGQELACEATVSGEVYGIHHHPFHDAVIDPDDDPRLGNAAISAFDPDSFVIFNFLLTNHLVYAFYERPAFARPPGGNDAAFQFAVPVLRRHPWERHHLKIAYDRAAGVVRWVVNGAEVFRVDAIGSRIDRRSMLIDHGGDDVILVPEQLDCGMAMFDFLDGYGPGHQGLVQIEADNGDYFNPRLGPPRGLSFVDPASRPDNRLFGQGVAMTVGPYVVSSLPVEEVRDDDCGP